MNIFKKYSPDNYAKIINQYNCADIDKINLHRQGGIAANLKIDYINFKMAIVKCTDIEGAECANDIDEQLPKIYVDYLELY